MSFGLYIGGFIIVIAGLIYGATLLHIAPQWIGVMTLVLVGLGVVKAVQATRQKDPPA
jgi:cadmium resistance protein CadD (predicted permease)